MFSKAVEIASKFTLPVIISKRLFNGNVQCGCGSFVILNPEGWVLTAAHILDDLAVANQHQPKVAEYNQKYAEICNSTMPPNQKRKHSARLPKDNEWITNCSYWWGIDGTDIKAFHIDKLADLAIGKLEPFTPRPEHKYPILRNPSDALVPGASICRLGFPFHQITATFDEKTNQFRLADGVIPMPRFPNDGIHTRICLTIDENTKRTAKFVETSTPGLRGQSGGPIFDTEGRICAIQSRTVHLPLGFAPAIKQGSKETVEHQFLNVGIGSHVDEIIRFLTSNGVAFTLSPATNSN